MSITREKWTWAAIIHEQSECVLKHRCPTKKNRTVQVLQAGDRKDEVVVEWHELAKVGLHGTTSAESKLLKEKNELLQDKGSSV